MKLIINFGLTTKKEVSWYKDVTEFPKLLRFNGARWEWAMYNQIGKDYELTFSQIPSYDPNFYADMESFEDMFGWPNRDKCECGAIYSPFSWDHSRFCRKWVKWDDLK